MFQHPAISRLKVCVLLAGLLPAVLLVGCTDNYAPSKPDAKKSSDALKAADSGPGTDVAAGLPQALPGAETGIPAWVGQDKDEPFDVKQFLESRAAPADNAAPLYFAALAEVSTEMYMDDPTPGWPWTKQNVPQQVRELGNAIGDMSDSEKLMSGSVPLSEVEAVLAKAQPVVKKLDEAQQRPHCIFITGLRLDSLLPSVQGSRTLARLACIQLYHARVTGNFKEAEQAVRRTLRLSRDLRPRGVMIAQLVSWTIDGVVLSAVTDFTLAQPGLKVKDCDRLLALLVEHEREAVPSVAEGIKTEYVTIRNSFDAFQKGQIPPKLFAGFVAFEGNQKLADAEKRLVEVNWPAETAALNAAFKEIQTVAKLPHHQVQADSVKEKLASILNTPNVYVATALVPSITGLLEGAARAQAKLVAVQCLVAVRRYQLLHNKLPPDLASATSEAGLKEVPQDPYSGQPMLYKVIDGKPVVYSVGADRKDDGGTVDWKYGQQPGDFIFRIRE